MRLTPGTRAALLAVVLLSASCSSRADDESGGDVTVFAAASLTAAFAEIGDAFTARLPGATATLNFAGSSRLVSQIAEGAPADVFASADLSNMELLVGNGDADGDPVVFATNVAEIIVAPGNPLGIGGLDDLADPDVVVVQCAPEVPCGRYAEQVLSNAGVTVEPKSFEGSVSGVVTKVTLGEADAGIVYATDVLAAGADADGVTIPDDVNVVAEYPIAVVRDAADPVAAQAFIDVVLSDEGRDILASHGFTAP